MVKPETLAIVRPLLKRHEGLRLKPYKCTAGVWTIGYGHNLEAHPIVGRTLQDLQKNGITLQEAETLLGGDIDLAIDDVRAIAPSFYLLDPVRQAVLIDMMFNLGRTRLRGFRKFLKAVFDGDFKTASKEMLDSRWAVQVKSRATRLARMMATGQQ
jgi:lysozyme